VDRGPSAFGAPGLAQLHGGDERQNALVGKVWVMGNGKESLNENGVSEMLEGVRISLTLCVNVAVVVASRKSR